MDLTNDVIEWLAGERVPMRRADFLLEITRTAQHNKLWPAAKYEEWDAAVDSAIKSGRVVERNGKLSIVLQVEKPTSIQMGLFE